MHFKPDSKNVLDQPGARGAGNHRAARGLMLDTVQDKKSHIAADNAAEPNAAILIMDYTGIGKCRVSATSVTYTGHSAYPVNLLPNLPPNRICCL